MLADEPLVPPRTQLDALVGVLASREDWLARNHAHCILSLAASRETEAAIQSRLTAERPAASTSDAWQESEQRAERLRHKLLGQQEETQRCLEQQEKSRVALATAHRRVEILKKAAERLRSGVLKGREKADSREQDELALLRFQRAG